MATSKMESGQLGQSLLPASDINKRKQTLLSQFVTAVGNFSVQYNFQSISVSLIVMAASVCTTDDGDCREGTQAAWVLSSATATVFVGAITGQLTMGYIGDLLGRNRAMTLTLGLVAFSAAMSAALPTGSATSIYITIIVTRFLLGIGVGGVYPLSATKAAEDAGSGGDDVDLQAASWAFFWQVPGSMTPWLLALIFSYCDMATNTRWRLLLGLGAVPAMLVVGCSLLESKRERRQKTQEDAAAALNGVDDDNDEEEEEDSFTAIPAGKSGKQKYRVSVTGIGGQSPAQAHSSNSNTGSSPLHTSQNNTSSSSNTSGGNYNNGSTGRDASTYSYNNDRNGNRPYAVSASDSSTASTMSEWTPPRPGNISRQSSSVSEMLQEKTTWVSLLVSGGCWFIYDVAYYGVNLFGGEILNDINSSDDDNVSSNEAIHRVALQQLIALSMGIPACIGAIYTLKFTSLKSLQVWGFIFIAFCFTLLACLFAPLSRGKLENTDALFAVYCLLLFSLTYGPNLTTFILPAQMYPREVRATFNGISAACGKLGAFAGVYMFGPMADATSYATVMVFCAVMSILGAVISQVCIIPLTKQATGSGSSRGKITYELQRDDDEAHSDDDSLIQ